MKNKWRQFWTKTARNLHARGTVRQYRYFPVHRTETRHDMKLRFLTYVTSVFCLFLMTQEKAGQTCQETSGACPDEISAGTFTGNFWSRVFIHDLSASGSPCEMTCQTFCPAPLRTGSQTRRTSSGKTTSLSYVKSGKTYGRDQISVPSLCAGRFPSGLKKPSHRLISLRKLVI